MNRELSFLRRVFDVALANGLVDDNPVKQAKFLREPSGRIRFVSEMRKPAYDTRPRDWPVIAFAINTGLRQGDGMGLCVPRWGAAISWGMLPP